MTDLLAQITALHEERAAAAARVAEIDTLLAGIASVLQGAPAAVAETPRPARETKAAGRETPRRSTAKREEPATSRPTTAAPSNEATPQDLVLSLLTTSSSPMKAPAMAKALKLHPTTVTMHLRALMKAKRVVRTGGGPTTAYALA